MFKSLDGKTGRFELTLNLRQIFRHHHEIDIDCVNRFDETIDGQAADQAPRFIPIQYCGDIGEIARTTICDRFKYFRCRHVRCK